MPSLPAKPVTAVGSLAALSGAVTAANSGANAPMRPTAQALRAPSPPRTPPPPTAPAPAPLPLLQLSRTSAARFLQQASFSSTATQIERVRSLGYSAWLDEQFNLPRGMGYVEWLRSKGYDAVDNRNGQAGANNMAWRKLIGASDVLRQRVVYALLEIIVINVGFLPGLGFRAFAAANFMDILEANAFGNYRTLLEQVSLSPAMGAYLSFRGNRRANALVGSLPDENYAREVMQLFSIGLIELNNDGTAKLSNGQTRETYTQDDVSQLARVFTGWDLDTSVGTADTPDRSIRPMVQIAGRYETGEKRFLGSVIPANTPALTALRMALDTLVNNPNVAPYIGRQLIQRLVCSAPSAAYVARVSAVFNNNGIGVKGDLKAVVRAILLDDEARSTTSLGQPASGKLREPMLRFVQWARSFEATSADDSWNIGDLSNPATQLGQSPLRSPSVFNFFRPGYVPSNSALGEAGLTAPELQITHETSVAGWINYLQRFIVSGAGNLRGVYAPWLARVADSAALLAELNTVLAAGQLSAATLMQMKTALDTISVANTAGQNNRLYAAITLVMAAPEYLTQK